MSDVFTSVTNRGLGDRLGRAIGGFFIGLFLFIVSFPVLWWNEGRTDMSTVAKTATVVNPDGSGNGGEGSLVAVTADLKSDEQVGDPDYLKPAAHLQLKRKVEMFAWVEKKDVRREKQLGGGEKEITTYTYDTSWTGSPKTRDSFEHPEGHANPPLSIHDQSFSVAKGKVGGFSFEVGSAELPRPKAITLDASMLKPFTPDAPPPPVAVPSASAKTKPVAKLPPKPAPKGAPSASAKPAASAATDAEPDADADEPKVNLPAPRLVTGASGTFLFRGKGTIDTPKVGDVRISYESVDPGPGPFTLYGQRQGTSVVKFVNSNDDHLYRVVPGTHQEAIATLHNEHVTMTWILRGVGFFAMWIGLALTMGPINTLLDVVPFIGSAGRFLTGLIMAPIAFVLSFVTILLSIIAHNPWLLILPIVLMIGMFIAIGVVRRSKRRTA